MSRDQEEIDRLARFDAIRTEILKDYRDNIASRKQGIYLNRLYIRLIALIKYVYKFFEILLHREEDFSISFSLNNFKGFRAFFMLTFFSEEERAHFSDLRMEWLKPPYNRYKLWWKIFNHLCIQKFLVAPIVSPILSIWRLYMYIFGSFK